MLYNPQSKIIQNEKSLLEYRKFLYATGEKLVTTNGCFDILHRGHIEYLYNSRMRGDRLLVLVNDDKSIKELKGPDRPLNDEYSRALILSSLYFVDAVYIFTGKRCDNILSLVKSDIYTKGNDYNIDTINKAEKSALLSVGTDIQFIDLVKGFSTTEILKKV